MVSLILQIAHLSTHTQPMTVASQIRIKIAIVCYRVARLTVPRAVDEILITDYAEPGRWKIVTNVKTLDLCKL